MSYLLLTMSALPDILILDNVKGGAYHGEDIKDIQRAAVAQGWTMKPTKKGLAFIPPDRTKQIVQWHGTPSDVRAIRNFLAEMRRQGFDWPPKRG